MSRTLQRRLTGGAVTVAVLAGCSSGPFTTDRAPERRLAETSPYRPLTSEPPDEAVDGGVPEMLPALGADSTLDDYLRYAALNNPGLEARFQEWKAAVERAPQVRALPDPRFTYGYYISEIETRVGPMQHALSLSQTFPWFGKLQDREDAASRNADAAYQRFEAARIELFLRVEHAYNELYFLKRSIDVTGDNVELLQQFERVARARYRVAAASHPDIIRVQVELAGLEDRLRQLRDLRDPNAARLNAALNRPPDAELPWPADIADRVTDRDVSELLALLRDRNPELVALQEEIARERINAEIARKDGLPDLTVGVAYTVIGDRDASISGNGDDAVLATFSVNLPLWRDKYEAGVRESLARRLAVANARMEQTNRLTAELQQAIFDHQDARRRVELYEGTLIPKATELLQASLGGFEQGSSDFLDLIDTERTLLEFQLGRERALVDRATSYAQIEQLVGARLTEVASAVPEEETAP